MCIRLGKKHSQYVGTDGLDRLKRDKTIRNPKRRLWDTYKVQILLASTSLRDVLWNPQCNNSEGISKRLKPSKAAFYAKLDKYQSRADTGR